MAMAEDDWDEDEYVELLAQERRRYAWVMERYGGRTAAEAGAEASRFYFYEEPDRPSRGLVFHDEAWHWAMRHLYDLYWISHPELTDPPAAAVKIVCGDEIEPKVPVCEWWRAVNRWPVFASEQARDDPVHQISGRRSEWAVPIGKEVGACARDPFGQFGR